MANIYPLANEHSGDGAVAQLTVPTYCPTSDSKPPLSHATYATANDPFRLTFQSYEASALTQHYISGGNNALGSEVTYAIPSSFGNVVTSITSVFAGPSICDALSTGPVTEVTLQAINSGTLFQASSASVVSTVSFDVISAVSGGNATATCAPILTKLHVSLNTGTLKQYAQVLVYNAANECSARFVRIGGDVAATDTAELVLLSSSGTLRGALSIAVMTNATLFENPDPALEEVSIGTPFFLEFATTAMPASIIVTPGYGNNGASTAQITTASAAVWLATANTADPVARTAVEIYSMTIPNAWETHNAYYVNGVACACIANVQIERNGSELLRNGGLSGTDLYVISMLTCPRREWDTGAHGNWGSIDELKRNAHATPAIYSALVERDATFTYQLPLPRGMHLDDDDGDDRSGGKTDLRIRIRYNKLAALARRSAALPSTDGLEEQQPSGIVCRSANHSHTSTVLGSSGAATPVVGLLVTAAFIGAGGQPRDRAVPKGWHHTFHSAFLAGSAAISGSASSNASVTVRLASECRCTWLAAAIQPPRTLAPATCGVGNMFSFMVHQSASPETTATTNTPGQYGGYESVNRQIPALRDISLQLNGVQRRFENTSCTSSRALAATCLGVDASFAADRGIIVVPLSHADSEPRFATSSIALSSSENGSESSGTLDIGGGSGVSIANLIATAAPDAARIASARVLVWADDVRAC